MILAGDVGTGKTELAESIGDRIARDLNVNPKEIDKAVQQAATEVS